MDMIVHDRAVWDAIREGAEFKCDADAAVVFVKGHHGHIRLDCEVTADIAATFNEADARRMAKNILMHHRQSLFALRLIIFMPVCRSNGAPDGYCWPETRHTKRRLLPVRG